MSAITSSRAVHTRWTWRGEAAGAVADLGVLVPIAVALVVGNGISVTAALLPAGAAYVAVALVYRVPVAVQPLKAFGAAAIAAGAGVPVIAAGALLMGVVFVAAGGLGLLDRAARAFPRPVVRGVQLAVAVTFARIAWGLVAHAPAAFVHQLPTLGSVLVGAVLAALLLRRPGLVLAAVALAAVAAVVLAWGGGSALGPTPIAPPRLDGAAFATAATLLVLPQLPLTFANSCLAPADAARAYFGPTRVTPDRLALTLGGANLLAGAVSGMPVCHGAGGMSAHVAAGARTWRAPALIGGGLVVVSLALGRGLERVLTAFPVSVLAALLVVAAVAHARLMRDVVRWPDRAVVGVVAVLGTVTNLAVGLVAGLVLSLVLRRRT